MALDLKPRKRIGLVAHDNKKQDLVQWARFNRGMLAQHDLVATGTTGTMLGRELNLPVTCLQSGPLGGDLQIGAMIADGTIDFLVFFWDPLEPQPHDTDVKSLLRIAVVWNIPVACDRASADFMISSPLMTGSYERTVPDYTAHNDREIPIAEDSAWEERAGEDPAGEDPAGEDPAGEDEESDRAPFDPALGSIR
jgi:methylglyoxal synthase